MQTRDEGSIRFELYAGNGANGNIALDDIVLQFGPCDAIDKCECTCRNVNVALVKHSVEKLGQTQTGAKMLQTEHFYTVT